MKRTILLPLSLLAVMPSVVHAQLVSTGDLGNNVIWGHSGGYFSVSLDTPDALTTGTAALAIKSGLWNGGQLFVEAKINGNSLGTFDVGPGYLFPGPTYTNFDVSGLIVAGTNLIEFQGLDLGQDYVIGQVDLSYEVVPEPASMAMLGTGVAVMMARRRRK